MYVKNVIVLLTVLTALGYALMAYFEQNEKLKLFKHQTKGYQIHLKTNCKETLDFKKDLVSEEDKKGLKIHMEFKKAIKNIALLGTAIVVTTLSLDFPVGYDVNSLAFYFGMALNVSF
jgi:hypothetical protein